MECPGCGAEVPSGAISCASCGRAVSFDAPPPPPSDWLPGAPLFGRGSASDPNVVVHVVPRPRRNTMGCGCGIVAIVVFVVTLSAVLVGVVAVGRSVNDAIGDPFDSGDDVAGAPLTLDRPVEQHLGGDDTGVHLLTGIEGRVTITVAGGTGGDGNSFDPVLQIVDVTTGSVEGENDDADGLDSRLSLILSTSDQLEVRVREYSGDGGDYTVTVLRGDDEVGVSPLNAGPLTFGTEVEGSVGRNQAAAYRFTGEGHEVTIDVFAVDDFDPVVRVLDGNGKELAKDDDGGDEGYDSRLTIALAGAQHVTIEVTGFNGAAGHYRIVVR